jgi:cyclic AMP-dependent transcription factor ATF-4
MPNSVFLFLPELQQITDKIDLPLYDFVTGNDVTQNGFTQKASKTDELLMEFDSIYDAVELDHLTPPQTPPEPKEQYFLPVAEESQQYVQQNIPNIDQQQQFVFEYQQQSPVHEQYIYVQNNASQVDEEIAIMFENSNQSMVSCEATEMILDPEPIISSPADLQRELEVVDEIIQAHSRAQSEYDDDNCTVFTSSSWSPRSECSTSSYLPDEAPIKKSSSRGVTKKRTRPYGRNPDEKKMRKKEQNKNAATRYRQKKKEEVHVVLGEERILMDKNKKLMTTFKDTRREVKYLKSLLRDLFRARGFIQ